MNLVTTCVCCLCVTRVVSSVTNRLVWLLQRKRILSVRVEFCFNHVYTVTLAIAYSINYIFKRYIFTLVLLLMPY